MWQPVWKSSFPPRLYDHANAVLILVKTFLFEGQNFHEVHKVSSAFHNFEIQMNDPRTSDYEGFIDYTRLTVEVGLHRKPANHLHVDSIT